MSSVLGLPTGDRCSHVVQLYASDAELVSSVSGAVIEAVRPGGIAVVIATEDHRRSIEDRLRDEDVDVEAAREDGTLVTLDAGRTVAALLRDGGLDRDAFHGVVGTVVREAAATGRPVLAFGEMVALLWAAGDVVVAIDLETAWDDLARECGCTVYCAYPSETVGGAQHADARDRMCGLHSAVVGPPPPAEGTWHFPPEVAAAVEARRIVADVLRRRGHDGQLLDDARIIVAELAANAVNHARSPFTVKLRADGSCVRIEVDDASAAVPTVREPQAWRLSGRGMHLVAAVAGRWGVELLPQGKRVWAELGRCAG